MSSGLVAAMEAAWNEAADLRGQSVTLTTETQGAYNVDTGVVATSDTDYGLTAICGPVGRYLIEIGAAEAEDKFIQFLTSTLARAPRPDDTVTMDNHQGDEEVWTIKSVQDHGFITECVIGKA